MKNNMSIIEKINWAEENDVKAFYIEVDFIYPMEVYALSKKGWELVNFNKGILVKKKGIV